MVLLWNLHPGAGHSWPSFLIPPFWGAQGIGPGRQTLSSREDSP